MNEATHYPVFLDLRGRTCVVLGDSALAEEKANGLRAAGAAVTHHRRRFTAGDLAGAYLAVDAGGDVAAHEALRTEADREHVLLNVVDVVSQCDWIAPAVVRRGPLQVAISTSGESPFLASTLRERLEHIIGEEWGPFTTLVGRVRRRLRRHGVDMDRQVHAYRRLLQSDVRQLLASSSEAGAAQLALAIETDARRGSDAPRLGQVTLVGAGPGDPGLITVAGREALMSADVVLHDSLVSTATLSLCGRAARTIDVGKRAGMPSTAQGDITAMLIAEARAGHNVVRLKGGDPFLFGRGGEEVAALGDAGIPVRVIPGVSSALAAPAAAGIPVTYRDVAASVAFVTGRRAAAADNEALEALARAADTLVVVMPGNLDSLAHRLASVLGPQRPAALVSSATTAAQSVVRAPIGRLAAVARSAALAAPVTLIVGDVVDVLSTVASARSQPGTTYSAAVAAVAGEVVHAATPRQTIGGSR